MKLLLIAGEVSADVYAAGLSRHLLAERPSLVLYGVGGQHLKGIVHQFLLESVQYSAVGLNARRHSRSFVKTLLGTLNRFLDQTVIDRVVLLDFQHHNTALARVFRRRGVPIVTYITPNFWMYNGRRQAQKIVNYSEKIITIFQKEYSFYKERCDHVYYFGHPLTELVAPVQRKRPCAKERPVLTLFPGSRHQEFDLYFDSMLSAVKRLSEEGVVFRCYLAVSSPHFLKRIQAALRAYRLDWIELYQEADKSALLCRTDCLVTASGSATLEAILYETPMVVLCALKPLTYWVAKYVLRLKMPYISLPNILAGQGIVPELVQSQITPERILEEIKMCLDRDQGDERRRLYRIVSGSLRTCSSPLLEAAKEILR